jgi:hypothetical protein
MMLQANSQAQGCSYLDLAEALAMDSYQTMSGSWMEPVSYSYSKEEKNGLGGKWARKSEHPIF